MTSPDRSSCEHQAPGPPVPKQRSALDTLAGFWQIARERLDLSHPATQLGWFTLIGLGLLALVHALAADRIAANERAVLLQSLREVMPADQHDNDLLADAVTLRDERLGTHEPVTIYRARRQGQPVAAIVTTIAPDGYNGRITLLVAIRYDGVVAGLKVLEHHETPGLGDGIENAHSAWIRGFAGRSLANTPEARWAVKRDGGDFDQFTGATITPRAVVRAVRRALGVFAERQPELWRPASPPIGDQ